MRRLAASLVVVLALAGCGTTTTSPTPSAPASEAAPSASVGSSGLTLLVFGDSWPAGDHCNGCHPWPELVWDRLGTTGRWDNYTYRWVETTGSLKLSIQTYEPGQAEIARADLILVSVGTNDLEPAFNAYHDGTCGGADQLDCFREAVATLGANFDEILTAIDGLRAGEPAAIRIVTMSNEFLSEEGAIELLGADFGATGGVAVTTMMRDMWCEAAAAHDAECVELGPVLNGPDLLTPRDINTQDTMQLVADTILASGIDEVP